MSQKLMDRILQRRALRGMAASCRMVVRFWRTQTLILQPCARAMLHLVKKHGVIQRSSCLFNGVSPGVIFGPPRQFSPARASHGSS